MGLVTGPPGKPECIECGMPVKLGEYHPFAACLMYRGCHDAGLVRANLEGVIHTWLAVGRREAENDRKRATGPW